MKKSRRGVSLVELLVVMSLCSLLLTTSAVVLHRLMRSQAKAREFHSVLRNGLRLADQFRRDVHCARTATTERLPAGVFIKLQISEQQSAQYEHVGGVIRRLLQENEKTIAREEYSFPASSQVTVEQQRSAPLLSLSVTNMPGDEGGPAQQAYATAVQLHVEAQLGRDQRFSDVPSAQEGTP